MGLTYNRGVLMFGFEHGWFLWAPMWFKRGIARMWNPVACLIVGHDDIEVALYMEGMLSHSPRCVNCNKELKVDGKYVEEKECKPSS
jgi:hypothetical protein